MTAAERTSAYEARLIKRRRRSTRREVETRRKELLEIIAAMRPMTVRQVFYQATVRGLVEKSEAGYRQVQTDLVLMRRRSELPYRWLTDNTRWQRKPRTYGSVEEALAETARLYRRALWRDASAYCEIWIEKDALAGAIYPITAEYDVPLMVARGYSSLSFLHEVAEDIGLLDVPVHVYHLGDFDPSGVNAGETIEAALREFAPDAEINFERLAVTPDQIATWRLPTRPTKTTDTRAKGFGPVSVELDAIEPDRLRGIVRAAIEQHLPPERLRVLQIAEASEREWLRQIAVEATP
jgi:hypothetical protein